jgi:hypothetical protein
MNRRLKSISRDPVYFITLLALTISFHCNWLLTQDINLNFYPLTFLCVAFVGYKYGRLNSLLVAVSSFVFYLVIKISYQDFFTENEVEPFSILFTHDIEIDNLILMGQSIWDFVLLAAFGFLVSLALDRLEKDLLIVKLSLDDVLPYRYSFFVANIVCFFRYLLLTKDDNLSADAQVNIDLPYGIKLNIKLLIKRVLFTLSLPLILAMSFYYYFDINKDLTLSPMPYDTAVPVILIFCWYRGIIQTIWLVLALMVAAFIVMGWTEGGLLTDTLSIEPLFAGFGVSLLTLIAAWWLDKLHLAWNTPALKRKLLRLSLYRRYRSSAVIRHYFPAGAALMLLLCTFTVQFSPAEITLFDSFFAAEATDPLKISESETELDIIFVTSQTSSGEFLHITYKPLLILLLILLHFCRHYNPYSISNTLLLMLLLQSMINLNSDIFFDQPQAISLHFFSQSMIQILTLSLVPVFYRFFAIESLSDIRRFLIIISLAHLLFGLVAGGFADVLIISFGSSTLAMLAGLVLHFLFIELGARLLLSLQNKQATGFVGE